MPDLKDVLKDKEQEMNEQIAKRPFPGHKQIYRNNETRPWSSQIDDLDFEDSRQKLSNKLDNKRSDHEFLLLTITKYKMTLILLVILAASVFFPVAVLYPVHYFSVQQSFIPEKTDSIASRLTLLSNRIEFASFPTDTKLPTSLVARRLNGTEAQRWVVEQIYTNPVYSALKPGFKPESVTAEINYDPNLEILTLLGYANTAEGSKSVTELYWQYFLKSDKEMDQDLQRKIDQWLITLNDKVDSELANLTAQIESNTIGSKSGVELNYVQNTLSESYATHELHRSQLNQLRRELLAARNITNLDLLKDSSDADLASLIQIRKQLLNSPESAYYFKRIEEVEAQIPVLIKQKLSQVEYQLKNIEQSSSSVRSRLAQNQYAETKEVISGEKNDFVRRQLTALKEQKADLAKLQSQLSVEMFLRNNKDYKVITSAAANENSLRPTHTVRYSLALVASLILPLLLVFGWARLNDRKNS